MVHSVCLCYDDDVCESIVFIVRLRRQVRMLACNMLLDYYKYDGACVNMITLGRILQLIANLNNALLCEVAHQDANTGALSA